MTPPYPGPTHVSCPHCGRQTGERCRDSRGNARYPVHAARRNNYAKWLNEQRKGEVK